MGSWNDGDTSDESLSLDYESEPYIPETVEDPDSRGSVDGGRLCSHKHPVERGVAFESINTGRRFYGCPEQEGYNCGVEWVDLEWPDALKNALRKLWDMYEQSTKVNQAKEEEISKLAAEKKQIEEKHNKTIKDTAQFFTNIEKKVHKENYQKIMMEREEEDIALAVQEERTKIEENMELKKEVELLKHIQANQAEVIRTWRKDATEGNDEVKQEKKRLEYAIADLLKAGQVNKSKIKRIKSICDE